MLPPGLPPPGTGLCPRAGGAPHLLVSHPPTRDPGGARRGPRVAAPLRVPTTPEPQHRPPPRGRAPVPGSGFPLATGGGRAGTGAPGQDQDEPGTPSLCWVPHFNPPPFFFISAQGEMPLRLQDVFLRG